MGCAVNSGIAPNGQSTFTVSRQAATGFSGSGNLRAEALTEASQYCASQQKTLTVIRVVEAQPPFVFGNFPKANVEFACWDASKIESIPAECNDRRLRKEIKGYKAAAECTSSKILDVYRERHYPYMDLIGVLEAARVVGAEKVDQGKISEAEYKFQLAELKSRLNSEAQKRDLALANAQVAQAQVDASNAQANAAMLHGLSAFITATRGPPTYNVNVCNSASGFNTCSYPR